MHRYFAGLSAEYIAFHAHEVANIEQFLEHSVVEFLVFTRTNLVAADIHLDTAVGILDFGKGSLTHNAAAHNTAGNAHLARLGFIAKSRLDFIAMTSHYKFCGRIRFNTHIAQTLQRVATNYLLFA